MWRCSGAPMRWSLKDVKACCSTSLRTRFQNVAEPRIILRFKQFAELSLLSMAIYIKEESTMQISVSSTLTSFHDGQFWAG